MRNLRDYLNLSVAASRGELGELIKAASEGVYEGMRGEYAPIAHRRMDKPGLLSRRSMEVALLGGAGSALPGAYSLVGPAAAGLHSEKGMGVGTALGSTLGAVAGTPYGHVGRVAGGAIGGAMGHEYARRKTLRGEHGSS